MAWVKWLTKATYSWMWPNHWRSLDYCNMLSLLHYTYYWSSNLYLLKFIIDFEVTCSSGAVNCTREAKMPCLSVYHKSRHRVPVNLILQTSTILEYNVYVLKKSSLDCRAKSTICILQDQDKLYWPIFSESLYAIWKIQRPQDLCFSVNDSR